MLNDIHEILKVEMGWVGTGREGEILGSFDEDKKD